MKDQLKNTHKDHKIHVEVSTNANNDIHRNINGDKLIMDEIYPYKTIDDKISFDLSYNELISTSKIVEKPNRENNTNMPYSFPRYVEKFNSQLKFNIEDQSETNECCLENISNQMTLKSIDDTEDNSISKFKIYPDRIFNDKRTTCMIKNIPNKYTVTNLMEFINETHFCKYDFLYLRMDFKNNCNVGYAFINFIDQKSLKDFYYRINGKRWRNVASMKIAELAYASIQGLTNLINKFKKSTVMMEEERFRPKVFYVEGEKKGNERKDVFLNFH